MECTNIITNIKNTTKGMLDIPLVNRIKTMINTSKRHGGIVTLECTLKNYISSLELYRQKISNIETYSVMPLYREIKNNILMLTDIDAANKYDTGRVKFNNWIEDNHNSIPSITNSTDVATIPIYKLSTDIYMSRHPTMYGYEYSKPIVYKLAEFKKDTNTFINNVYKLITDLIMDKHKRYPASCGDMLISCFNIHKSTALGHINAIKNGKDVPLRAALAAYYTTREFCFKNDITMHVNVEISLIRCTEYVDNYFNIKAYHAHPSVRINEVK